MIPAETITRVRESHDLVGFIEGCGIKLRGRGSEYFGLCPWHPDTEPSLAVSPAKQRWCCHGACSAPGKVVGGDVIEFARRIWGVSFPEALRRLAATGSVTETPAAASRAPLRLAGVPARPRREGRPPRPDLLGQVVAFCHQTLLSSVPAKEYLASRGITDPALYAALPIGYADGSLLERAPEGSETYEGLRALGVLTEGGRELLLGCVVVPLRDLEGNVVDLYGRAIDRKRHLYLPGPKRGLVNAACAATSEELVIAESVFDALSYLEAGIPNAIPMYGANGWTSDHDALLEKHRIRRVIFALDPDKAGRDAVAA
ncbi:MAG: CHC2 zinc finger domain-containing protein, partial [Rubrobacteraceae bacterium]